MAAHHTLHSRTHPSAVVSPPQVDVYSTPLPNTPADLFPGAATQSPLEPSSNLPSRYEQATGIPFRAVEEGKGLVALKELWLKNCEGLDESQRGQLWDLLVDFQHCFAFGEGDLGRTHLVQHEIETGDAMPIRLRPRRLPFARQDAADKALLDMQRAGIIEPSESAWAAPVVMVPKKGGSGGFALTIGALMRALGKTHTPSLVWMSHWTS